MPQASQTTAPTRRYCVGCRFFIEVDRRPLSEGRCGAPEAVSTSLDRFIAPQLDQAPAATSMRGLESRCGEAAKWFEAAPLKEVAA